MKLATVVGKVAACLTPLALAGCNLVVLNPSGDIAIQERNLIGTATLLMLVIVVPVIGLTLFFAWKYRASNTKAAYEPDWSHSIRLELIIWCAPLAIILCLGTIAWISTHRLDPFRPLERTGANMPVGPDTKPLLVEVVALDWKWLFFYPDYGIATVNELAAPIDTPISFKLTAASVMNSFFIPALAGQIYAMPGMETKLHAVMNTPGVYDGFSANYSGAGFSEMRFKFNGLDPSRFAEWVERVKSTGKPLDAQSYAQLALPSEAEPPRYFSSVSDGLYTSILNRCTVPGKICTDQMMHIDAMGGGGSASEDNLRRLHVDSPTDLSVEPPASTANTE